jgi:DNA-binding transcriptional LysR family regulator
MDSDQLRAFVALARTGKFTAAAKRLGATQPTLSRRVQQLERELGARLVVRAPGGVVLTDAGTRFLPRAEHAVASIDAGVAALDELATEPRGTVIIGAQHTIGAYALPPVLALFHARHPGVRLRMVDALQDHLEEKLASGELDLGLFNLPVRRLDLTAQKLWQEDYVLAVPPQHRLAGRKSILLADAVTEDLVVIPNVPATAALEAACAEQGLPPRIVVEVDNLQTARRLVERGMGVALLPRIVARSQDGRAQPTFIALEITRGGLKRQVALVHRGEAYLSAAARALRTLIVESLRTRAAAAAKASGPKRATDG